MEENKDLKNKNSVDIKFIGVFALLYLAEILSQEIMLLIFNSFNLLDVDLETGMVNTNIYLILLWLISKLVVLVFVLLLFKKRIKDLYIFTKSNIKKFFIYTLISFGVFYLFQMGSAYYQQLMDKLFGVGETTNQETIYEYFKCSNTFINYFMLFLAIVVVAPFIEEVMFRETIFRLFKNINPIVPIIVSALLFGAAHLEITNLSLKELAYFPVYFIPGLALALIYNYSGKNFFSSFLVHLTINLISYIQIISLINQGLL